MAGSAIEEILEQRRRQKATAERNKQKQEEARRRQAASDRTKDDQATPTRRPGSLPPGKEKDDRVQPTRRPASTAPARLEKDDVYKPPKYAPVKYTPASDRTKDDQAQPAPAKYRPYLPPGKEKDDKATPTRPAITPFKYDLIPSGQPMAIGLTGDRPDTGVTDLDQTQIAQAPTTTLDIRGWKPERTKDDEAFPEKKTGWFKGWGGGGDGAMGMNAGVSPGLRYLAGAVGDWGAVGRVAGDIAGEGLDAAGKQIGAGVNKWAREQSPIGLGGLPAAAGQAAGAVGAAAGAAGAGIRGAVNKWAAEQSPIGLGGVAQQAAATGQTIVEGGQALDKWGANTAVGRALNKAQDWAADTPGGRYAAAQDEARRADDDSAWDRYMSNVWGGIDQALYMPTKIISTEKIPGTDFSVGQVASAAGEAVNRWVNPFNPNQINKEGKGVETPVTNAAFGWMKENLPLELANALVPMVQPFTTMWDIGAPQFQESQRVREKYEALPADQQDKAKIAGVNIISGPTRWEKTMDAILNQDQTVQDLEAKAREAYQTGDAEAAASYGAQAWKLQNQSAVDLVDENANPWAEVMEGVVLDPTNLLPFGVIGDAWKAYKLKQTFDITEAIGVENLDTAMKSAQKILAGVGDNQILDVRSWWQKINPLAQTADTRAQVAADNLFRATAQIFGNVTTKEDGARLMNVLLDSPQKLIQGVTGLTSPGMADQAVDGVYKMGAGAIANKPLLENFPIWQRAADELRNLQSLAGEGAFNPLELMAEVDNVLYRNARKMFGLDVIDDLPAGAVDFRVKRLADGTGVIEYLDKAKKVVKTTAAQPFAQAQDAYKALRKNILDAGGRGGGAYEALRMPDKLQRAIMSDMYLAIRPAHWIRNAASATATLMSDGNYSIRPIAERIGWWAEKHGGVFPEAGLFGNIEDTARGISTQLGDAAGDQNWTRAFWPTNNPYAAVMEAGNKFWSGFTNVAGVPFGENAFRMTAFDTAGQRVFRKAWGWSVEKTYGPVLQQMGIDSATTKKILSVVVDAGIGGDKAAVAAAVRKVLNSNTLPFNLRELGIPDELLSLPAWKNISSYLSDGTVDRLDEVADAIRMTFRDEGQRYARILNAAPPEVAPAEWTAIADAQDGADIIDSMVQTARRAGIDPAQAKTQAADLVKQLNATLNQSYETFRAELAQQTQPGAVNFAMDTWARYRQLKQAARAELDEFGAAAVDAGTTEAWAKKWEETRRIWGEFGQQSQTLFDDARAQLMGGNFGDNKFDWYTAIESYVKYDDEAVRVARAGGANLGAAADTGFTKVIEANRQYLDQSVLEVFDAFRLAPSTDNFDLLVNAQKKIDQLGAQAAQFLAEKRDEMLPKRAKQYYALRNQVWAQFFDSAVVHNNVTVRLIVSEGVAQQAASKLRWVDEFAGAGEFQLVGKNAKGNWQARNLADNTIHEFKDPSAANVALPEVPQNILNDYYKVTGETDKIVDDVIKDLKAQGAGRQAAPAAAPTAASSAPAPVRAPGAPTATEEAYRQFDARSVERVWEQSGATTPTTGGLPARTVPAPEVAPARPTKKSIFEFNKKERIPTVGDRAAGDVAGLKDARAGMREEWARVAVNDWGLPPLDQMVLRYQRQGIVNIPENLAEDIYGNQIAGRVINSQKDVEDLILEYSSLQRQADKSAAVVADSKRFKGMDRDAILEQVRQELIDAGYTADDIAKMNKREVLNAYEVVTDGGQTADEFGMVMYESTTPLIDVEGIEAAYRAQNPYNINLDWANKTGFNPFGLEKSDTNLYDLVGGAIRKKTGNKVPEMGNVALHMTDQLKRAERQLIERLPELLQGVPNALTPGQRVAAVDALGALMPEYDNVLAMATKAGEDAMNFAMLNFRDRRNIDTVLAMAIPFHFFWSRSAINWGKRVLQKPALLNLWYESERGIRLENQQANVPERLRGTLPNPLNQYGIGNERIANPVNWILPFASYTGSEYEKPEEAQSDFEYWYSMYKKWTPGLLPVLNYGADAYLDRTVPQSDGRKRTDSYQVGDYIPLYRMAGYVKQVITGENLPGAGDEFDQDRVKTSLSEAAQAGADPLTAQYAQQIAVNRANGRPDGEGIPPERLEAAQALYVQGSQAAGGDRLESLATGYFGGNATQRFNPEEQQLMQIKEQYNTAGYDLQSNRWGSKEAKDAIKENNPALPVSWSRYDEAPGTTAQYTEAGALGDTLWAAGGAAVDALLAEDPEATKDDIYTARLGAVRAEAGKVVGAEALAKFEADYKAANNGAAPAPADYVTFTKDQKFPNADEKTFPEGLDPYKGMNPEERRQKVLNDINMKAQPGEGLVRPEWPGDDATQAEKDAYNKAKAAFDNSRRQAAIDRATTLSGSAERGLLEIDAQTAGEEYDKYQKRNMTEAEAERVTTIEGDRAVAASFSDNWAEYKKLEGAAKAQYLRDNPDFADYYAEKYPDNGRWWDGEGGGGGGQWGANWTDYKALGDDSAAKAQYMKDNPEFAAMYAEKYGNAWWENYTPGKGGRRGSGDFKAAGAAVAAEFGEEGSATWAAYYALDDADRAAYKAAHPEIKVYTMAGYNPEEYAQAKELFGDEAWTEWANIPPYADTEEAKAARAAYLEEHPQAKLLSAWLNGRPGNYDESAAGGDDFAYNFGADFAQAEEMFGDQIWSVWAGYSSGWDKATKRAYHAQFPELGKFMDWWYGNETSGGGRSFGGRSYGGGGGRSYGGGGGGGGGWSGWGGGDDSGFRPAVDLNMPYIQNEGLSRDLQVQAPAPGRQRRGFDPDWWMKAGDRVGPDRITPWKPSWKNK